MRISFKLRRCSKSLPDWVPLAASGGADAVFEALLESDETFGAEASVKESNRTSPGLPSGLEGSCCRDIVGERAKESLGAGSEKGGRISVMAFVLKFVKSISVHCPVSYSERVHTEQDDCSGLRKAEVVEQLRMMAG